MFQAPSKWSRRRHETQEQMEPSPTRQTKQAPTTYQLFFKIELTSLQVMRPRLKSTHENRGPLILEGPSKRTQTLKTRVLYLHEGNLWRLSISTYYWFWVWNPWLGVTLGWWHKYPLTMLVQVRRPCRYVGVNSIIGLWWLVNWNWCSIDSWSQEHRRI